MNSDQQFTASKTALSLEREFLQLTLIHTRRYPIPVCMILLLMALLAYGSVPLVWIVSWLLPAYAVVVIRVMCLRAILTDETRSVATRLNWVYWLNSTNAIMLALSMFFFPHLSDLARALHTILIAGLGIGVVASNAGMPRATLPYLFLTLVPLALAWATSHNNNETTWQAYVMGLALILFLVLLITIVKDNFRMFKDTVNMRLEYADINTKLEQALRESEASNAAKTRFLAAASHDLRQPVHTLSLLTAALMSRQLDQRTAEISHTMDQSLQSLAKQLDGLLDISKLDAGIVVPEPSNFNLDLTLQRLRDEFAPVAAQKQLILSIQSTTGLMVYTDPTLLERILRNLISNAIKYSDNGEIVVRAAAESSAVNITISDTGIGISADKHRLIFEEFYQVSNPHRERSKGLGLGLSIVRRLTRLLDIELTMASELGRGSQFQLTVAASAASIKPVASEHNQQAGFNRAVVLVVDDEVAILKATQAYLSTLNCEVLLAEGYAEAITLAEQFRPDLLITDFRLRDHESGLDVIKGVRKLYAELPAIVMTGDTAPDRLQEAQRAEATLLHKPISTPQLAAAMRKLLAVAA